MIRPRADPETPLTDAAPVAKVIGLPVGVGGVLTPVEPTVPMVELATPTAGEVGRETAVVEVVHTKTVTVLQISCQQLVSTQNVSNITYDCAAATEAKAAAVRAMRLNCILTVDGGFL